MAKYFKSVYLVNDMDHDYKGTIYGNNYEIPKGGKIKLRRSEAAQVMGHFPGDKVPHKFHLEPIMEDTEESKKYISQLDGKEFDNEEALQDHLNKIRAKVLAKG